MNQFKSAGQAPVDEVHDFEETSGFPEQNWFQTLVTIPLLTASAGAVFMLLPVDKHSSSEPTVQSASTASFGLALRDPSFRQHQGVVARIENDRQRIRFANTD